MTWIMHMENNQYPLMFRIGDTVYRLEYFPTSRNMFVRLAGFHKEPSNGGSLYLAPNTECCVFSQFLDMVAYIQLREKGDKACATSASCDYVLLRPDSSLSITCDTLKLYATIHGYLRINSTNKVVSDCLRDMLPGKYFSRIHRYGNAGSLIE